MNGDFSIPPDLAHQSPGPELNAVLDEVDPTQLDGCALVDVAVGWARQAAYVQAKLFEVLAEIAHLPVPTEFAADEVRVALCWTRRYADHQVSTALRLVEGLPNVLAALKAGQIQGRVAELISDHTVHLHAGEAVQVADRVLESVEKAAVDSDGFGGLTTGQVSARLRRLCAEADPESAKNRYQQGVEARRVVSDLNSDGTAELAGSNLPTDRAALARARIDRIVDQLKRTGMADGRTMDQLRADTYLDLLEGTNPLTTTPPAAAGGGVEVVIPFDTLTGAADKPGDLAGWGPVLADVARQVAERQRDGRWWYSITDPTTGQLLDQVLSRRRPPAEMARFIRARDKTCRHPGCRTPAARCDLDHTIPVADGGTTCEANLGPECRHDHRLKHEAGWTLEQPSPGVFTWTTPTGHHHTTRPPHY